MARLQWFEIRALNVVIGGFVFASALLWPHAPAEYVNALVTGGLCAAAALVALFYHPARYLNAVLGVWLFASWVPFPVREMGTVYLDLVFGMLMMIVALAVPAVPLIRRSPVAHAGRR